MEIYLIDEANGYTFRYPVAPLEEINIPYKKRFKTHDIVDYGPIDLPLEGEEMEEIEFETIIPYLYDPSYCNYSDLPLPNDVKEKFKEFKDLKTPLRLIITGINFNELVILSEFKFTIKAGESDDYYLKNTFRKYREASISGPGIISKFVKRSISKNQLQTFIKTDRYTEDLFVSGDKVKVNSKSINIRREPDLSSSIEGELRQDTVIELVRVMNKKWGCISYKGSVCYIYLSDVTKYEEKVVTYEE